MNEWGINQYKYMHGLNIGKLTNVKQKSIKKKQNYNCKWKKTRVKVSK